MKVILYEKGVAMFYLRQKKLPANNPPARLIIFNYLNLGLIVGLAIHPFPKHLDLYFMLTALLGALLTIPLVLSTTSKLKRSLAAGGLLIALIISLIVGRHSLIWAGTLLAITSLLVLVPFIFPKQFNNHWLRLVCQFLLAPYFFLATLIFNGIHFLPEALLVKIGLFLGLIFLFELIPTNKMLTVVGDCLWLITVLLIIATKIIVGWQLLPFIIAQLLLLATQLGFIKNYTYLHELYYLIFITGLFL